MNRLGRLAVPCIALACVIAALSPGTASAAPVVVQHHAEASINCTQLSLSAHGFAVDTAVHIDVTNEVLPYLGSDVLISVHQTYDITVSGGAPSSYTIPSPAPQGTTGRQLDATWFADNEAGEATASDNEICSAPAAPPLVVVPPAITPPATTPPSTPPTVSTPVTPPAKPATPVLTLKKYSSLLQAGGLGSYKIVGKVTGATGNVVVTDRIPTGLTLAAMPPGAKLLKGVLHWHLHVVEGHSFTLTIKVRVDADVQPHNMCNIAYGQPVGGKLVHSNAACTHTTRPKGTKPRGGGTTG